MRFYFLFFDQWLCIIGFIINISPAPYGAKYFGLFLIAAGSYAALPTVVAWLSSNLRGQTKRAVGVSFQIGIGNFGGLIASNSECSSVNLRTDHELSNSILQSTQNQQPLATESTLGCLEWASLPLPCTLSSCAASTPSAMPNSRDRRPFLLSREPDTPSNSSTNSETAHQTLDTRPRLA